MFVFDMMQSLRMTCVERTTWQARSPLCEGRAVCSKRLEDTLGRTDADEAHGTYIWKRERGKKGRSPPVSTLPLTKVNKVFCMSTCS